MCTCNAGTGRVNDTDVTLPCLGKCHNTCAAHLLCGGFRRELNCCNPILSLSYILLNMSSTIFIAHVVKYSILSYAIRVMQHHSTNVVILVL